MEAACVVVDALCKSKSLRIVGCYYAPMGVAEIGDLKDSKNRVIQALAAALMPGQSGSFTVCLVFSNADSGKALSVPSPPPFVCSSVALTFTGSCRTATCRSRRGHWRQAAARRIGSSRKSSARMTQVRFFRLSLPHSSPPRAGGGPLTRICTTGRLRANLLQSLNSAEAMQAVLDMDEHMEQSERAWPEIK